jgi:hypothetical protein
MSLTDGMEWSKLPYATRRATLDTWTKHREGYMPILRIDLFHGQHANRRAGSSGSKYFPADAGEMGEVRLRWCGQCRLEADCGILAKVEMMLALTANDFPGVIADAITGEHDRRPEQWVIQPNGQPRCESMRLIGVSDD